MQAPSYSLEERIPRAQAWVAAWSAVQRSTERVDRDRAERAMSALYAERGLERPRPIWVDSPSDGVQAWHLVAQGHTPLRNHHTKGDQGNGDNRLLYQLQDPFGLEPAWQQRAMARAQDYTRGIPGAFRPDGSYSANGLAVRANVDDQLDQRLEGRRHVPPSAHADDAPLDESLARRIIGDRWTELTGFIDSDLLIRVAFDAITGTAADLLDDSKSAMEAMRALTYPQFDRESIAMGALPQVLGIPLWRQLAEREERTAMVERRLELARCGAAFWAFEDMVIFLDRPLRAGIDDRGRLHAVDGPALAYPDGLEVWADHGVVLDRRFIEDPTSITVADIDGQTNAEIRRVLIERFGSERLIREGGADLAAEDETGRLWRRTHGGWRRSSEPLVMVEVQNSTPEPDGSVHTYFLRVPPNMRTAREAVAWTFGLGRAQYEPMRQT